MNRWLVHRWWLEAGVMSWLEAAAPRFGSRVSLDGLSTHVCGVRLSSLDFVSFSAWPFNQISS